MCHQLASAKGDGCFFVTLPSTCVTASSIKHITTQLTPALTHGLGGFLLSWVVLACLSDALFCLLGISGCQCSAARLAKLMECRRAAKRDSARRVRARNKDLLSSICAEVSLLLQTVLLCALLPFSVPMHLLNAENCRAQSCATHCVMWHVFAVCQLCCHECVGVKA